MIALVEEINRLKMVDIDWDMINKWIWEGQKKAKGVTLNRFEIAPEESIEEFCQLFTEVINQVPKGDMEWEFKETSKTRRMREKRYKKLNNIWTTIISKEKDGTISGLTETFYRSDQSSILQQGLTGVKKEFRGRSLGKMLKAEMITYIKEAFPEVKIIYTDFAITNEPMIEINKRLGFRLYKANTEYKFQVMALCKILAI
jgi:RimJ/RimL family protein N-acetyltransferase